MMIIASHICRVKKIMKKNEQLIAKIQEIHQKINEKIKKKIK
jgi:hypothetical protein